MSTPTDRTDTNRGLRLGLRACLLTFMVLAVSGVRGDEAGNGQVSNVQREQIEAAQSPEALVGLAKQFVLQRKREAARVCIEKACQADPALLTDNKRQAPTTWREFWFGHRAVLREQALAKEDAAGRVAIAVWLHEAGVTAAARKLLKATLELDGSLPEAHKLAQAWNLFGGGPFRFDLTYALTNPLLLESLSDEGTAVEPRRGHRLMLLPFAYEPAGEALRITKSSIKVTSDDGRPCRIVGIVLLVASDSGRRTGRQGGSSSQGGVPTLQAQNDPVWERIEVTRAEDGTFELICFNTTPARGKQAMDRDFRSGGRDRSSRRGSTRSSSRKGRFGSSRGQSQRGSARGQTRAARGSTDGRRQTRPASGYAAFVVQVPELMQSIEATYRDEITIKLETELLEVLGRPVAEIAPDDREPLVEVLAEKVTGGEPLIASAAVGKLALIRDKAGGGGRGFGRSVEEPADADRIGELIDRTLLAALVHTDGQVRRQAFDALVNTDVPLSEACLAAIHDPEDTALAQNLLDQVERTLGNSVPLPDETKPRRRSRQPAGKDGEQTVMLGSADLPVSPASAKVFAVLRTCLNSRHAKVHGRAVDTALTDGSQQSAASLLDVPRDTRAVLVERFANLSDGPLKAVLLRILLADADPADPADQAVLAELLGACDELALTLTGDQDPVLTVLKRRPPIAIQVKLLELLGRADLSVASAAEVLNDLLTALAADATQNPALRSALLELALGQFQPRDRTPVPRASKSEQSLDRMIISDGGLVFELRRIGGPSEKRVDLSQTFESLLARLATAPGADAQSIRAAAGALVRAGRLTELDKQLTQTPVDDDRVRLIHVVAQEKELWAREALPIFLAGRLTDRDPKAAQAALAALADIYQATDANQQWRLNLAVKLGVNLNELAKLTLSEDDKLARSAISLLRQLGKMSAAESDQLQSAPDSASRRRELDQISRQRAEKPEGKFACMVYLDVKPGKITQKRRSPTQDEQEKTGPSRSRAEQPKPFTHSLTSIPFVSSKVLVTQDEKRGVLISAASRNIGVADTRGKAPPAGTLRINASALLLNALKAASQQKHPLADFVDRLSLSEPLMCDLRHKQLGTWTGEVKIPASSGKDKRENPLEITGAMIVLEPVTP